MSNRPPQDHLTRRDAESLLMLGGFLAILAVPVLIGTLFAVRTHAMVVNLAAGIILLLIGLGFLWRGWTILKQTRS